ncbi:MAG: hypothetical protein KKC68_08405 [Candidatus Thermoplasmatota archaeon]|nr:hypothetical protein [Candidatus Thermoplasmatota archaeon]MBU1941781.1 hypothetical protein [Candidatus Thermoplasmatota archaeon]
MNTKIETMLDEVGSILEIGKEEIKMTLKHKKGPIIAAIVILAATLAFTLWQIPIYGKRYAAISPLDFAFFKNFPFSFLL